MRAMPVCLDAEFDGLIRTSAETPGDDRSRRHMLRR
jgi:hypothetical protein